MNHPSRIYAALLVCLLSATTAAAQSDGPHISVDYKFGLDIFFPANASQASPAERAKIIEGVERAHRVGPRLDVWCALVAGYADPQEGGDENNRRTLIQRRALEVKAALVAAGLSGDRVLLEPENLHDRIHPRRDVRNRRAEVELYPC